VIVDAIKSGVGRPRPHFYAQCFGSTTAIAVTVMTCSCVFQTSLLVVIIL
jgi:hypothetical protein